MIYFITDGTSYVKIGYAVDVDKRIKTLQVGNPRNLHCMLILNGGVDIEHMFHEYFKDYRIKLINSDSCEWFYICGELKRFLDINSTIDIEDYLAVHFPRKRLHVYRKSENYESELYYYKREYQKQQQEIKALEKKMSKLKEINKKLNSFRH